MNDRVEVLEAKQYFEELQNVAGNVSLDGIDQIDVYKRQG